MEPRGGGDGLNTGLLGLEVSEDSFLGNPKFSVVVIVSILLMQKLRFRKGTPLFTDGARTLPQGCLAPNLELFHLQHPRYGPLLPGPLLGSLSGSWVKGEQGPDHDGP